ncbi:hypothetical protein ACIQGZ_18525 [Streptomyces sp. NPDC092296]|uniref:hypothetical protein n=1 Tax=Streptomyces sp. NPDC092296 TaxID=3366012 RepID=UPI0037F8D9D8
MAESLTSADRERGERHRAYYTLAALRARGWTPSMVRDLLGGPDAQGRSPFYGAAAPTRMYSIGRVEAAEGTEEFARALAAAARRSAVARQAAARRRQEVLDRIAAEPVEVPTLTRDDLADQAVRHRNRRDRERAWDQPDHVPRPAVVATTDPAELARWQVNYLRHRLTAYDALLDGLYGGAGRTEAAQLLRERMYDAIARAYPELAAECRRQLAER